MNDRDKLKADLEELSPKYDDYVVQALDYANDRLSPQDAEQFRDRMRTDEMFRRVAQPVLDAWNTPPSTTPEELRAAWDDLRRRIAAKGLPVPAADLLNTDASSLESYAQRVKRRKTGKWRHFVKIAAVFAFLMILPVGFWVYLELVHIERITSKPNVFSTVRLPDQSTVQLAPGSSVRYSKNMATSRNRWVELHGEGTFTVVPAANATFVVETDVAKVTVVGTRFTVQAFDGSTLVQVEQGKVSVQRIDSRGELTGKPLVLEAGGRTRVTTSGIFNEGGTSTAPGARP